VLQKSTSILNKVASAIGTLGLVTIIWNGLDAAHLNLSVKLFGENIGHGLIQTVIDAILKIHPFMPYIAVVGGIVLLSAIIGLNIANYISKRKKISYKTESPILIAEQIRALSMQLEESLKREETQSDKQ